MKTALILVLLFAFVFFTVNLSEPEAKLVSETVFLLDTACTITIYKPLDRKLILQAFDLCAEYEALLSVTVEGSDIWRVNHALGEPMTVSPETIEVIMTGLGYGDFSRGWFDVTIGRLSELWDFSGEPFVPDEASLSTACDTVNYRQVVIHGDTVQLSDPEAYIDLGGIAKGYIADRIAAFLVENGAESAIVDLGGNIVAIGERPDGNLWRVGIRKPFGHESELFGVIEVGTEDSVSVVTAGVYERSFELDDVLYHHILNPFTGLPVKTDVVSATVVTESSMSGDALSTTMLLLGSDVAVALLDEVPGFIGAIIILDNGEYIVHGDIDFTALGAVYIPT